MSSIESYEGLCGCIHRYSTSDLRVRCKYEFAHSGPHSWEKKQVAMSIIGGSFYSCTLNPDYLQLPGNGKRKKVVIGH